MAAAVSGGDVLITEFLISRRAASFLPTPLPLCVCAKAAAAAAAVFFKHRLFSWIPLLFPPPPPAFPREFY